MEGRMEKKNPGLPHASFQTEKAGPGRAERLCEGSGCQFCHPKPAVGGSRAPRAPQGRCRRREQKTGIGEELEFHSMRCGGCVSHLQEIRTAHQVPKQGKINSCPMMEDRQCMSGGWNWPSIFLWDKVGKKKEANRNKFTKLCFLLFEIGKGSLGNNDQV